MARAPAMSPEQRRAMIVAAALPLVVEHGAAVTTAQIARAAGIGEGTVFRAFEDKDALLAACMAEALRLDDTLAHIEAIPRDEPLAARLLEAIEILQGYLTRMGAVAGALMQTQRTARGEPRLGGREEAMQRTAEALQGLFEPDRDRLRKSPEQLAHAFQHLVAAARGMPPEELVDLFLHGAVRP
ncbi:helix-turn-helix domain-containing protein [Dactylosporangium sp. AC04546]|uniref:TetR/AcrR family transcriptional regulator n=1 Tax=Dactylosporangium sp. AC04546 TaxID=2862460 RepID=UPI001EE110A9|nr:TetR/AcrR family transcriptional regulator [Dactylosporangium sp. AC04546]WVK78144.1 helix-turn-helix domain-containing protein [Dactylosporangium sp. AC04546]